MNRLVKSAEVSVAYNSGIDKGNLAGDLASSIKRHGAVGTTLGDSFATQMNISNSSIQTSPPTKLLYSNVTTLKVTDIPTLEMQIKNIELQKLFKLPANETIVLQESPCYFFNADTTLNGNLYLSNKFLCFGYFVNNKQNSATLTNLLTSSASGVISTVSGTEAAFDPLHTSLLYDKSVNNSVTFVVPYPHVLENQFLFIFFYKR